jgi:hypothetical protein
MLEDLIVYGVVACATSLRGWRLLPGVLRDALGRTL